MRILPIRDTIQLHRANTRQQQLLTRSTALLAGQAAAAQAELADCCGWAFERALVPFAVTLGALRDFHFDEIDLVDYVPEFGEIDADLAQAGLKLVQEVASGDHRASDWIAAGLASSPAFAVRAPDISVPDIAVPDALVGKKAEDAHREQLRTAQAIAGARDEMVREHRRVDSVIARADETSRALDRLGHLATDRLFWFRELVDRHAGYVAYAPRDRAIITTLAGIAATIASLLQADLTDADGALSQLNLQVLEAGTSLANRIEAPRLAA